MKIRCRCFGRTDLPGRAFARGIVLAAVLLCAMGLKGAPPAFAQAEQTVKIGMSNSTMNVVYPFITNAQYHGFFKQEGVKADVVMGQGSSQVLSLLIAGTVDMVYANAEPMIQLNIERGQKLKGIYTTTWGQYVLAVTEDSPIQSIADLKGKRLGMFGPQSGIDYLKARLFDAGMSVDDITIVPTGFGGQALVAIRQKQVDAILYWPDAMVTFYNVGLKLRELPKAEWEKGLFMSLMITSEDSIKRKSDALARAVRAMAQGQMLSVVNPEQTVETFWKQFPDQAPRPGDRDKAMRDSLNRINTQNTLNGTPPTIARDKLLAHQWGHMAVDAWSRIQDNLARIGSLSRKTDPASFVEPQFTVEANRFDRAKVIALGEGRQ